MVKCLISFPGQQTRCIQLGEDFLARNDNGISQGGRSARLMTSMVNVKDESVCTTDDNSNMDANFFYSLINALYGISMDQFYLIINGKYVSKAQMCSKRDYYEHIDRSGPNNWHCSMDRPLHSSVPNDYFRESSGNERLEFEKYYVNSMVDAVPISVAVKCRILGGKGGFGAILKSQAGRKKQSTNLDSCRNLQGQRIRTARLSAQAKAWEDKQNKQDLSDEALKLPKKPQQDPVDVINTQNNSKKIVKKEIKKMKKQVQIGVQEMGKKQVKEEDTDKILETCLDIYGL
ncbi:conserved hypothetical protein [Theileria equi strain WA]|uniref:SDE2-like domain-containing protein n=1 Tax=Theileria equi strain WA TaxID=1537102 RepID=L1LD12_THEEQ|nr:conserved hypothetical protein [Theileria equi strain WA]EKX73307.1 conserved hypothetical protein [Theileria equi strain WA]|eukprot:XP_004832759.1 conserved hypothetical protein [Theileria equi strain WA]